MAKHEHTSTAPRPLIFGEVLYDCFPDGSRVLGGAPFNVAWHLRGFGLDPLLLSAVGDDAPGQDVLRRMRDWGMDTAGVQTIGTHPTGTVAITLHGGQHTFHIAAAQAYDHIAMAQAAQAVRGHHIGPLYHGTLAARDNTSRATLHRLRRELHCPVFVDINLRAPWWQPQDVLDFIQNTAWTKLNDDELYEFVPDDVAIESAAKYLAKRHHIDNLLVTRGAQGALLLRGDALFNCIAPEVAQIVDSVGAGDAFSAVFLLGLARHWPPQRILRNAAEFAAAICGRRGAIVGERKFYEDFIQHWED